MSLQLQLLLVFVESLFELFEAPILLHRLFLLQIFITNPLHNLFVALILVILGNYINLKLLPLLLHLLHKLFICKDIRLVCTFTIPHRLLLFKLALCSKLLVLAIYLVLLVFIRVYFNEGEPSPLSFC